MPTIIPFRGFCYNPEYIKDISEVLTPPYDIISPQEQDKFYSTNEFNIIRLSLGKDEPEDNDINNKYGRAAGYLREYL